MKRMELVDFELAFKEAVPTHKKVGWVSVFDKTIHFFKSFIFKAKAFSFCLFYCTLHRHSERSEESSYFSPGSFVFVLRTSLRMTAWKHPLFTF
jgi:hypothetical protein